MHKERLKPLNGHAVHEKQWLSASEESNNIWNLYGREET